MITDKTYKLFVNLNLILILLTSAGCGSAPYNKRYYILDANRHSKAKKTCSDIILDVRTFTIDSAFDSKGLVYRKGEFEYEADFYNEFLVSPATMITEKTRSWLSQSGLFARVLDKAGYSEASHILEGNITSLYIDFREKASPLAIVEMRIFLVADATAKESLILGKTYKSSSSPRSGAAEDLVEAFDHCLEEILTDLEKDLAAKLQPAKSNS